MLEATYLLRLAYLAKFLNVGGLHVVQFQAFRKPFDEKLLFGHQQNRNHFFGLERS